VDNWYEILGVPENVEAPELETLEAKARRKHHSDRHVAAPQSEKDWHEAQLKTCLEGVSFLLTKRARDLLDEQLRQKRATAQREEARRRNEKEARRRGDADDLRARFGSPRRQPRRTGATAASAAMGQRPPGATPPRRPPGSSGGAPAVVSSPTAGGVIRSQPPVPTGAHAWRRVGVELATFLLVLIGCLIPPGIIVALALSGDLKNPSFGVAVIGFFCSIGCLASVVGVYEALGHLSGRAFGVLVSLCVGGLLIWRLVTLEW
jgi:hypothetical protein